MKIAMYDEFLMTDNFARRNETSLTVKPACIWSRDHDVLYWGRGVMTRQRCATTDDRASTAVYGLDIK